MCLSTRVYLSTVSACTPRQRIVCLMNCFHECQKLSCSKTQDDEAAPLLLEEVSEREPEAWDMQVKRMECRKLSEACCGSVRGSGELCSSTRACFHCNSLVDRYETKTLRVEAKLLTNPVATLAQVGFLYVPDFIRLGYQFCHFGPRLVAS